MSVAGERERGMTSLIVACLRANRQSRTVRCSTKRPEQGVFIVFPPLQSDMICWDTVFPDCCYLLLPVSFCGMVQYCWDCCRRFKGQDRINF
jgi:hypothetical protein